MGAVGGVRFTPALSAWFVRLLIDELSRPAPSARRAALLVLAGAAATLVTVVGVQLGGLVTATLHRSITTGVQDTLYRHVNSWVGLRHFEDPAMQDRLRLAEQGAAAAPQSTSMLMSEVFRGTVTILSFVGALLALWPPMALLLAVAAVPALIAQRTVALRHARATEINMATVRRQAMFQQLLTDPATAKEVRLYGLGDLLRERLRRAVRETSGRELAVARRGALTQTSVGLLAATVTALGGLVAVREVLAGRLTLGGLTLFTAAVIGVLKMAPRRAAGPGRRHGALARPDGSLCPVAGHPAGPGRRHRAGAAAARGDPAARRVVPL